MSLHLTLTLASLTFALCAARSRPHAIVFAVGWLIAEIYARHTGEDVPRLVYFIIDQPVFAATILWRRGPLDYLVMFGFACQWWIYLTVPNDYDAWWPLWGLSFAQAMALGPWRGYTDPSNQERASHDPSRPQFPLA